MIDGLPNLRIVLVGTQHPGNIGSAARAIIASQPGRSTSEWLFRKAQTGASVVAGFCAGVGGFGASGNGREFCSGIGRIMAHARGGLESGRRM